MILLKTLLSSKIIFAELGGASEARYAKSGAPEGGVLSSLPCYLATNTLLRILRSMGYDMMAYADLIALTATGKQPQTISDLLQNAICLVSNLGLVGWCFLCDCIFSKNLHSDNILYLLSFSKNSKCETPCQSIINSIILTFLFDFDVIFYVSTQLDVYGFAYETRQPIPRN